MSDAPNNRAGGGQPVKARRKPLSREEQTALVVRLCLGMAIVSLWCAAAILTLPPVLSGFGPSPPPELSIRGMALCIVLGGGTSIGFMSGAFALAIALYGVVGTRGQRFLLPLAISIPNAAFWTWFIVMAMTNVPPWPGAR
jgi:hypothetical protein